MAANNIIGFPNIYHEPQEEQSTRPMGLHEFPMQVRIEREMAVIHEHHPRIGKAIALFWGHSECAEYLQKLILSGGDGFGNARVGFRREVLTALINLTGLDEELQRPPRW